MKQVYITQERNVVFVCRFDRQERQRHFVAQFDAGVRDIEGAREWVKGRTDLQLVCAISGKPI